jgi:Helix-turn-helix domain
MNSNPAISQREDRYSIAKAWTPRLAKTRFVPVVRAFLENYSTLKPFPISHGEAMFIIHLMQYKWDEASPFPGYKRIAKFMGVSDKMVRRYALSLQQKGYLIRVARRSKTNLFDLRRLFDALERNLEQLNDQKPLILETAPPSRLQEGVRASSV